MDGLPRGHWSKSCNKALSIKLFQYYSPKKHPYKIVKQNILNKIDSSRWKNYSKLCYNYFEKKMTMCLFFIEYKILIYIQNWQML